MMERAAVPPRTIKKVSDLFGAATFILDFFWGGIKSPKNTTLSSEFESSLQNVCAASRRSNFGPISKAACFWILGEGHTAALRAGVTACVLWRAPWFQWGGQGPASGPVSTRPRRPCPPHLRCKVQFQRDIGIFPQTCLWNPLRGFVAEGVGLISASGLHPCGAAFGSLCRFAALELRSHPTTTGGGGGIRTHGAFQLSSFQDWRNRPLYHPSV